MKDIKAGTYEYARTCEILLVAYGFDEEPVQLWDRTQENIPGDLQAAFNDPKTKYIAHNSQFDRTVLRLSGLFPEHVGDFNNWECTMVKAMLHGFTGSLDKLGGIFGLDGDEAKLKDGKKLINRFCKPAPKNHKADRYTAKTHPEEWKRFCDYAVRDVETMRKIAKFIPSWNWCEEEYYLDQTINDRGFQVDLELVKAGAVAASEEKINLAERFIELTEGEVEKPTQRAKFLEYLNNQFDLGLENTQKATLEPLLKNNDLDPRAASLIQTALMANKTSTAKYAALEPAVSPDERFRGGLQFSGATRTRRWCLTGDHEVLTDKGWVRLDKWTGGTIAQWGQGNIYFEPAEKVEFSYEGDLITVQRDNRIDAAMTPEHVLCANGGTGRKTASSAYGRHVTGVERHGVLRRKPVSTIKTRVLVMLQHDGSKTGNTVVWTFVKKRKFTRCQKLLAAANIPFTTSQKASGVFSVYVPVGGKPQWLEKQDFGPWLLEEKHCPRTFIDEIEHWDGGNRRDKQIEVCSKGQINAEWTATMAHLAGFSATVSRRANSYWYVNVSKSGNRVSIKPEDWGREAYKGKVYCAATRTGFFLVRRNGVVHVTGNSGRSFQPQNLPSRGLPKAHQIETYIKALKNGVHDILYDGELMLYGSAALRGVLTVPKSKKLCVSDLANIEGRANAWLAGEDWKLRAFLAYDTFKLDEKGQKIPDGKGDFERMGPDLYKVAAGKILGKKPNEITSDERNSFGKVTELALGYEGGVGAIQNFATAMDVAFADHWDNIEKSVSRELILQAEDNWDSWGKQKLLSIEKPKWLRAEIAKLSKPGKLPDEFSCAAEAASSYWVAFGKDEVVKEMKDEWIASEVVKLSWRDSHPAIKTLWHDCKDAAVNALDNPGQYFKAGRLRFRYVRFSSNNYLVMVLPSRKVLVYYNPRIVRHLEIPDSPNRNEVMRAVTFVRKQLGARVMQKLFRELRSDLTNHLQLKKKEFLPFLKSCQRELEKLGSDGSITYWGVDAITKQWSRQHIYGGKFVENACQGLSRDILMQGIFSAEASGYKPVLTVHDELVTECPDTDEFSEQGLSKILSTPLNWCPGFPLAAEGFEAYRYRK